MMRGVCDDRNRFAVMTAPRLGRAAPVAAVFAVLVVSASIATAQSEGPIERLEAIGRGLRGQPAWRASYHQEYVAAGMTAGEEADGKVWVSWPDRALFRTGDPVIRMMGMGGRRVRLVDLEVASCDDHRIDDEEWARIPLAAILDPKQAVDRFSILDLGDYGVVLVPREPGGVARLEVFVGSDRLPTEVVVIDPQGATNRLQFAGWQPAEGPPGGQWLPASPPGIECVAENGPANGSSTDAW
jgi:hypothetical protein